MNKFKIGIISNGFIGKAFYNFFKNHYEVFIYDLSNTKENKWIHIWENIKFN